MDSRIVAQPKPTMFPRRVILLAALMLIVMAVLAARLFSLTIQRSEEYRQRAESVLVTSELTPTRRGTIYDRNGIVLAEDTLRYNLAVRYPVLTGQWQREMAARHAYREEKDRWLEGSEAEREWLIEQHRKVYDQQVANLYATIRELEGITEDELQQRINTIRQRVLRIRGAVMTYQVKRREAEIDEPVSAGEVAPKIGEEFAYHPLAFDLSFRGKAEMEQIIARAEDKGAGLDVWQQVTIQTDRSREYPNQHVRVEIDTSTFPSPLRKGTKVVELQGVASHIIGAMRPAWKEDFERRPYRQTLANKEQIDLGGYLEGDKTGRWGIEESLEDQLRGLRGKRIMQRDTGETTRIEAQRGKDVYLTIDLKLQARVQALLKPELGLMQSQPWHRKPPEGDDADLYYQLGDPMNGAVVVLDVATGEVLAAVSQPTYDINDLIENYDKLPDVEVNQPFVNRAVARAYQPGSTVKPIVLASAGAEGKFVAGATITCDGMFDPSKPNIMRCWLYKVSGGTSWHGVLHGDEAICVSCNDFFYNLGWRMGNEALQHWFYLFGLGQHTHSGLPDVVGDLGDLAGIGKGKAMPKSECVFMGIGQGRIRWTPIQAAGAYATLARQGDYINPTFLKNGEELGRPRIRRKLVLDPGTVKLALDGLYQSANTSRGTTHHLSGLSREVIYNVNGVRVLSKSGTADAADLRIDSNEDGRITTDDKIVRKGDHAWCIALVQRPGAAQPEYVVAAMVEYAGSGGAVSGPIVNQVIHALQEEGYLDERQP